MKLRLPLNLLAFATIFAPTLASFSAKAAEVRISTSTTVTQNIDYPDGLFLNSGNDNAFSWTIGDKDLNTSPVVKAQYITAGWNSNTELLSGELRLGTKVNDWGGESNAYSMWIGCDDYQSQSNTYVNVRGGKIIAESRIWLGRWNERAELNIYDGLVKARGIYSVCISEAAHNPISAVNLLGGRLELGDQGIASYKRPSAEVPSIYKVNLHKGTLGSYASWSSTRDIIMSLDSLNAVLPDGTKSDGAGSVTIDAAKDTTITINSLIEGTGTGEFIKTGGGTLQIEAESATPNTFTQNIVLAGGTLSIKRDVALGVEASGKAVKTIVVRNDGSSKESAFVVTADYGDYRLSSLSFLVTEGSSFVFKDMGGIFLILAGIQRKRVM